MEVCHFKVNESRCKQCGVTPHFSIYLKKLSRKDKNIDIINWEKLFPPGKIDLLSTINAVYRYSLILTKVDKKKFKAWN